MLLAFAPPEIVDESLGGGIDPPTARVPDEANGRTLLEAIARDGSDVSVGEIVAGSVCVAAPIISRDGIVGALGVIGPEARCGPRWRSRVTRTLGDAARELGRSLGVRDGQ